MSQGPQPAIVTGTGAAKRKDKVPALEQPTVLEKSRPVASLQCDQSCDRRKSRLLHEHRFWAVDPDQRGVWRQGGLRVMGGHAQPEKASWTGY